MAEYVRLKFFESLVAQFQGKRRALIIVNLLIAKRLFYCITDDDDTVTFGILKTLQTVYFKLLFPIAIALTMSSKT